MSILTGGRNLATLPLAGVRILSLAEQYPGPFATMLLADLGADVILVERPAGGDPTRRHPGLFVSLNRNKRSVVLDLKSAEGHAEFLRLVDTADVVMEGFRPGVMARLRLDAQTLRARKPSLVFVSISSFGQDGPMANVAGHDLSIQAVAGMIEVAPGNEHNATLPRLPLADIASGMFAALSTVCALLERTRSGSGSAIDVSMLDALVSWMTPFLVPAMNGIAPRPLPPEDPGYGLFATADGGQITLSIAGEDHMWAALCGVLGLDDIAAMPDAERSACAAEIVPRLREAIARHRLDWLCKHFEAARIAFGPVRSLADVTDDPQVVSRGMVVEHDGTRFIRQPLLINGHTAPISRGAPALGEHTDEVLATLSPSPALKQNTS